MNNRQNLLSHTKITVNDIPDIDLYMDQLTGYIEKVLGKFKVDEDEKILTKTMINNYVKAKLINKPVKKKYNKNQIMQLIMIYQLKNILSIAEIGKLFKVYKEQFEKDISDNEPKHNYIESMYGMFLEVQEEVIKEAKMSLENHTKEDSTSDNDDSIRCILKLVLKADINKRLAELKLKEQID